MKEKELKKWVERMYDKYKAVLFIEKYHLKVEKTDEDLYLGSKFNYPYLDMKILYSAKFLEDWGKDKVEAERRLIHEFCHSITDPLYAKATNTFVNKSEIEDERERLTDHIAQIINKHFALLKDNSI